VTPVFTEKDGVTTKEL
jgi:phospholipid-translocating ATPase